MKLIGIEDKDNEKEIFRIFPMDRFLEVLEEKKLTFVKPRLWRDPMDRLLFEYYFHNRESKDSGNSRHKDSYFAQCWTLTYESHALWNEYAPLHNGVRVKTTIGKLRELFNDHPLNSEGNSWQMGCVNYLPINEIKEMLEKDWPDSSELAHTLLIKLSQYSHEQEVRIIFNCNGDEAISGSDIYRDIKIKPLELLDKLLLDPRMPENIYNVYKEKFLAYGFEENQIIRSELYDEELLKQKIQAAEYAR